MRGSGCRVNIYTGHAADRSPDKSKRSSNTKLARILDPSRYRLFEYLYIILYINLYTYTSREQYLFSYSAATESVPSYIHDLQRTALLYTIGTGCFVVFVLIRIFGIRFCKIYIISSIGMIFNYSNRKVFFS